MRQKAGVLQIALPVLEIDFLVRNIPVTTNNHLAAFLAPTPHAGHQLPQKDILARLGLVIGRPGGQIQRHNRQRPKMRLNPAALGITNLKA